MTRILNRYLLRELLVPFFLSLVVLTLIVLIQQVLKLMDLLINKGVEFSSILKAFVLILPSFFLITIPMAVLIASLMAFNRLSFDRELVALKSLGVGFSTLMRPLLFFLIAASLISFTMAWIAEPLGGNALNELTHRVIQQRANVALTEGTFNTAFDQMMIYVSSMPKYNELKGVLISDLRHPEAPLLIVAKQGRIVSDPERQTLHLVLENGTLDRRSSDPQTYQRMSFARYDLAIDLSQFFNRSSVSGASPSYRELVKNAKKGGGSDVHALRALQEFYKNFTFASAPIILGLIGAPLGMVAGRASRLGGFAAAVVLITLYYLLTIMGDFLVSARYVSPFLGAILPNVILLAPMFFLVRAALREKAPCR
ncbi:MAG TPA: LptF/LptG family permease [Nitrospiria bacterium]|nr:LptF/LptG family permease [Nitrospiria bacterium]